MIWHIIFIHKKSQITKVQITLELHMITQLLIHATCLYN